MGIMNRDNKRNGLPCMMIISLCTLALMGCSAPSVNSSVASDAEVKTDSSISATSVDDDLIQEETEEVQEDTDASSQEVEEKGIGLLKPEAIAYFGTTYSAYLKNGGEEAEFMHGGRYIGACSDLDASAVYVGQWHNDTMDFTIEDNSIFLRLEGSISEFFTGNVEELTDDEFLGQLSSNYRATSEYMESAGTAYYVSGSDYLHLELVSKDDNSPDTVIEIAKEKDEKITPDSYCWVMEKSDANNLFSEMPGNFVFSSGVGGWSTDIEISEDGSFVGQYHDSDMGATGEGYPNGTLYICSFSGKFSNPEPTDKENIYSLKLLELNIDDEDKLGTEEIVDEMLYVYTDPYGLDDADEFFVYLPGVSMAELPEECRSWTYLDESIFREVPVGYYILYNIGGQEAFTAQSDDAIWYKYFIYNNGSAYVNFTPSFYMGSNLTFFTEEGSPAALSVRVPWDGKNVEAMESKEAWGDGDKLFNVTVEPVDNYDSDGLKYRITVECAAGTEFDFTPWGGENGKFNAEFVELVN